LPQKGRRSVLKAYILTNWFWCSAPSQSVSIFTFKGQLSVKASRGIMCCTLSDLR